MYGKGMVKSDDMNGHKAMAGAGMKGNFGVTTFPPGSSGKARTEGVGSYKREAK